MHNWKEIHLKQEDTLSRAIEVLESEPLQIVLVVDNEKKLLGTITGGDVRRTLINMCGMETSLDKFMTFCPTVASVNDNRELDPFAYFITGW